MDSGRLGAVAMSSPEMSSPFPGMNPYLENPDLGPEVHHLLISLLAETLNPQLLPHLSRCH